MDAPTLLAPAATGVSRAIRLVGGSPDAVFRASGVEAGLLDDPFGEIELARYCRLFDVAAKHVEDDNFGLRFGIGFAPGDLGILGYLALNAETLGLGIDNFIRFFSAHQQGTTVRLVRDGDLAGFAYQVTDTRIRNRRQDAELSLGIIQNIFRHALGHGWRPAEVHFEHPVPANRHEHERLFGAPVFFGQKTNAFFFDPAVLRRPMPGADARLLAILERQADELLRKRARSDDLAGRVRHVVEKALPDGYPRIEAVSEALSMPSWTLRRRLQDAGVTYHELVEETRCALARHYLAETETSLTEIALLLGYSEVSAFNRAFKRWTDETPAKYRSVHRRQRFERAMPTA